MIDLKQAVRKGEWLEMPLPLFSGQDTSDMPKNGDHPYTVKQWLLTLEQFPEKWINRLFSVGGIRLENGVLRLRAFPEADLRVHLLYKAAAATVRQPVPPVLFEDDHCLVFDKPIGMPVHPAFPGQSGTLDEASIRYMLQTGQSAPVRHIHRLDEDTSGPVLYAKNDLAQWRLDEAMRSKQIERRYIALVQGIISQTQGTIDEPIGRDRHHSARRRVSPTGDQAVTHYEVLERYDRASLVRIQLETGRTHQIRVHFSYLGHPLIGDKLYGGDQRLLDHQALHGERLFFSHPWDKRGMEIHSPYPAWLSKLIQRLS
ncbi:RluA family pseudouridine synthase [Paenibacillus abyssi]|uniref:Pseudouridine synthase n=1 Tax=Paenibacillus abyssi TaxID=1340531 RepID=A0A917LGE0_9BACL|nr:RluA family pseudouridine synthase [Paenibacillus abyssi]GGG20472.1 pseudouridine synthase [Paenibacillus abyssi]